MVFRFVLLLELLFVFIIGCDSNKPTMKKKDKNVNIPSEVASLIEKEWSPPYNVISVVKYECGGFENLGHPVYYLEGEDNQTMICQRKGKIYLRLDCPKGIPLINDIFKEMDVTISDFKNDLQRDGLLRVLVQLYNNPRCYILSSHNRIQLEKAYSNLNVTPLSDQLKSASDKEDLESLYNDLYEIERDVWKGLFNVMKADGSVEEWVVYGSLNSDASHLRIDKIDIQLIRQAGSFIFPLPYWNPQEKWPD